VIIGTGIDVVKVDRIRQAVDRTGQRFLDRVFSKEELDHCMKRKDPYPSLAARFAAKEACIKAVPSIGFVVVADVETGMSPDGKPYIKARGKLAEAFERAGVSRAHLSLTHEKEYAVAMVILEG
jgi:holo-[acyl-carrier protein] synthase